MAWQRFWLAAGCLTLLLVTVVPIAFLGSAACRLSDLARYDAAARSAVAQAQRCAG